MTSIGFHTGPAGNRNGIGNYWQQLHNAGIPFFQKAVDDYGPCYDAVAIAKTGNVPHTIVFRLTTFGQNDGYQYDVPNYALPPAQAAAVHWTRTKAKLPPEFDKSLVWVEPINEIDKNRSDWLGDFAAEIGALAMSQGYKVTLFGWSSGEPEPQHWQTPGMKRYLTMCAANPDRLAVSLHEYSYTIEDIKDQFPYKLGRFQALFAACDAMGIARPTVHITEWGWTHEEVPEPTEALIDIDWAYRLYAPHPQIKGVAIWYLGAGFGGIANLAQRLIGPVTYFMLHAPIVQPAPQPNPNPDPEPGPEPPPIPVPPPSTYLHARLVAPANIRRDPSTNQPAITPVAVKEGLELIKVGDVTGQPVSGDNRWVKAIAFISRPYVTNSTPGKVKTNRNVNLRVVPTTTGNWPLALMLAGVEFEHLGNIKDFYNDGQWAIVALYVWKPLTADVVPGIRFGKLLPGTLSVTSPFNSPRDYAGEHEGLDFSAPIGTPVFAGATGVVDGVRTVDPGTGYGKYVRVKYSERYKAWFGHLSRVDVTVGQTVTAGQQIGLSGNSGGSTGPHLHLTLQDIPAGLDNFIVDNVTDPTLYLHPAVSLQPVPQPEPPPPPPPSPPPGNSIDLVPYFVTSEAMGKLYEVQTENAGQQRHQTQVQGTTFFHTKDAEWEQLKFDNYFIYRGIDTSPGGGRYYRLNDADNLYWSRWAARRMTVGQIFERKPTIAFYRKSDCAVLSVDEETNYLKLKAAHNTFTFFTGIVLNNVIELEWLGSPGGSFIERYYYAIGCGLVGWESSDGRRAAISEIHAPGARPNNAREIISCL